MAPDFCTKFDLEGEQKSSTYRYILEPFCALTASFVTAHSHISSSFFSSVVFEQLYVYI